jgi:ABC-2 type transport system ATP-binding protein
MVPAVEAENLSKTYKRVFRKPTVALDGACVSVEPGTIFGLLGANGAGKTTLVKILLSLVNPTNGRARVLGHDPVHARTRRRIGYLPELMKMPEYMRGAPFLRYMARLNGVAGSDFEKRIPKLMEIVGLPGEKKLIKEYSKGMQQRLGLAQALINDPELLFLDEPTEGLDPLGRKQVRDLLVSLRAAGKTIFLNSHLLSEIELVCNRVLILNKGKVALEGTPAELTRQKGEYRIRVAEGGDAARAAVAAVVANANWNGNCASLAPENRAQLNEVIDRLRGAHVEIEAVEPVHSTLEESFIQVVTGDGGNNRPGMAK